DVRTIIEGASSVLVERGDEVREPAEPQPPLLDDFVRYTVGVQEPALVVESKSHLVIDAEIIRPDKRSGWRGSELHLELTSTDVVVLPRGGEPERDAAILRSVVDGQIDVPEVHIIGVLPQDGAAPRGLHALPEQREGPEEGALPRAVPPHEERERLHGD